MLYYLHLFCREAELADDAGRGLCKNGHSTLFTLLFHTQRLIAGCMSRNFEDITTITRKCVEDMELKKLSV